MRLYYTGVLRKKAHKHLAPEPTSFQKENIMKKTIAILLILTITGFGLFAAVDNDKNPATINITTIIADYSAFGVSTLEVLPAGFRSIAAFEGSASSSINATVPMLSLSSYVPVGFLSGINNTKAAVNLGITIADLKSGSDTVEMLVSPASATIAASANSNFGTLRNTIISVKEATSGKAALAPAGTYTTTVTITLTSN